MSPMQRPNAMTGLRKAATANGAESRALAAPVSAAHRVSLNLPPDLYREIRRWCEVAADDLGWPVVSVQDGLRALIRAGIRDTEGRAVTQLVRDRD